MRFPGQYFDSESGLHYNYFRDYEPSIGRYITSDPIGLEGGNNTYAYADSDPILFFDFDGLQRGARTPGYTPIVLPRGGVAYVRSIQFGNLSDNIVLSKLKKIDRQIDRLKSQLSFCQSAYFTLCWKREHTPGGLFTTDVRLLNIRSTRPEVGPRPRFSARGGQFWRCIVGKVVGSSSGCCEEQDQIPID